MISKYCDATSDTTGLPYICSLEQGHAGDHEAHTDEHGTVAARWSDPPPAASFAPLFSPEASR